MTEQIQKKIIPKFSNQLKNSSSGSFMWQKIILRKNPALPYTTSYGFLTPCQNFERTNDPIPREYLAGQMDGWTDFIL